MQQRTTIERKSRPDETRAKAPPSFIDRLWRNQLGITSAVALTLAAAAMLFLTRQG